MLDPATPQLLSDRDRAVLRHMVATLAYRGGKALRDAPDGFGDFQPAGVKNPPRVVLAHIGDLLQWATRFVRGDADSFVIATPGTWAAEVDRFFAELNALDHAVQSPEPLPASLEQLFQAPIADALTHIGQIALLRRMAGAPVLGEAYRKAEIVAGRIGPEQAPPGREFPLDRGAVWRDPSGN
ncbi:MAG: hypothetical protein AB7U83_15355 [Vicinamibacterales bacterium]